MSHVARTGLTLAAYRAANPLTGHGRKDLGIPYRDGPNNVANPRTLAQWQTLASSGVYVPAFLFSMEDALFVDEVLGQTTLSINGSPETVQTLSGWTMPWVKLTETAGEGLRASAFVDLDNPGELFNVNVQSVCSTVQFQLDGLPGSTTVLMALAGAAAYITVADNGRLALRRDGEVVAGTYNYSDGAAHFCRVGYGRTAEEWIAWTDQEVIAGTFADFTTDGVKSIGAFSGANSPPPCYVRGWEISIGTEADALIAGECADMGARGWDVP